MSRFGELYAVFFALTDLTDPLPAGVSTTQKQVISATSSEYLNGQGQMSATFIYDSDLVTIGAVGKIMWLYKMDTLAGGAVAFGPAVFIDSREVGPEPNQITISGYDLSTELKRWTIHRPIGALTQVNTTLDVAAAAPVSRTLGAGAPAGVDRVVLNTRNSEDVHKEIRITLNDASVFVSVVTAITQVDTTYYHVLRDRVPSNADSGNAVALRTRLVKPVLTASFQSGVEVLITTTDGVKQNLVVEAADSNGAIKLRDGLTHGAVDGAAISSKDWSGKNTSDVTDLMAYAADTTTGISWAVEFETGTGTADGTAYPGGGETIYDILKSIAAETGEFWRLRSEDPLPYRSIQWRRTHDVAGSSGTLRLVMPVDADMATDSANVNRGIIIGKPAFVGEYDPVTIIFPVAADARASLYFCSAAAIAALPTGYAVVTTGLPFYWPPYVKNTTLLATIGEYQRRVSFSEVTIEGETATGIQTASDRMLGLAVDYLKAHDSANRTIVARCVTAVYVQPGQRVELVYASPTGEYTLSYTGGSALYVQSVRRTCSSGGDYPGVPITELEMTTEPANPAKVGPSLGARFQAIDRVIARGGTPASVSLSVATGGGGGTEHIHAATSNAVATPGILLQSDSEGAIAIARAGVGAALGSVSALAVEANSTGLVTLNVHAIASQDVDVIRVTDADYLRVLSSNGRRDSYVNADGDRVYPLQVFGPSRIVGELIAAQGVSLPDGSGRRVRTYYEMIDGVLRLVGE